MLKYSIAAVALVASSTVVLADPNTNGPGGNGPGPAAATMERSGGGATVGGQTEGNGGPAMKGGAVDRGDSGSEKMTGDRKAISPSRENAASEQGLSKGDREQAGREGNGNKLGDPQAGDRSDRTLKNEDRADRAERNDRKPSDRARDNSRADRAATGASEGTEGKAQPKGSLTNISSEQKTRVRSAFVEHRVAPARDIGVAVNVGIVIPHSVHVYPIPAAIVTIVPDYSGYDYFMIDESHVAIVDPDTLEVVDIIVVA